MNGEERRRQIASILGKEPHTAGALAEKFGVSRQVIVQDVALLRAEGHSIVATSRGYICPHPRAQRVFKVRHTDAETREELYLIADAGGRVEDVFVWHKVYGKISAPMGISSRRDADEFMKKLEGVEHRSARFVSAICCVFPNGDVLRARGECPGEIAEYERGENGFGYDAMFIPEGYGLTMAELSPEEKNAISHRGRALREFCRVLEEYSNAHK